MRLKCQKMARAVEIDKIISLFMLVREKQEKKTFYRLLDAVFHCEKNFQFQQIWSKNLDNIWMCTGRMVACKYAYRKKNGLTGIEKKRKKNRNWKSKSTIRKVLTIQKFLKVAPNNMLFALKITEAMNALFQTLILLEVKWRTVTLFKSTCLSFNAFRPSFSLHCARSPLSANRTNYLFCLFSLFHSCIHLLS